MDLSRDSRRVRTTRDRRRYVTVVITSRTADCRCRINSRLIGQHDRAQWDLLLYDLQLASVGWG